MSATRMELDPRRRSGTLRLAAVAFLALAVAICFSDVARGQFGIDVQVSFTAGWTGTGSNEAWSVATDGNENVHVIYRDYAAPGFPPISSPWYAKYDDFLGVWLPAVALSLTPPAAVSGQREIAIATDCLNNVHALWTEDWGAVGLTMIFYRQADALGVWGAVVLAAPPIPIPPVGTATTGISLAADQRGNAYAVWSETIAGAGGAMAANVFHSIRDAGTGVWSPPAPLTAYAPAIPAPMAIHPSIAVDNFWATTYPFNQAVAHFAWCDFPAGGIGYAAVGYTEAGGQVALGGGLLAGPLGYPSIAARCLTVHVVWSALAGGLVFHSIGTTPAGGPGAAVFGAPVPTGMLGGSANIAIDGLDNVHLVLDQPAGISWASWRKAATFWMPLVPVSDPGALFPMNPSIAVDEEGAAHIVWADLRNDPVGLTNSEVYYDRHACLALPVAPPGGPTVAAILAPELATARQAAAPEDLLPVLIHLAEQPDQEALRQSLAGLSASERRREVSSALQEFAQASQASLLADLADAERRGEATDVRSIWLINAVAASVSPGFLDRLAARSDVAAIDHDPMIPMLDAVAGRRGADAQTPPGPPPTRSEPLVSPADLPLQTGRTEPETPPRTRSVA